MSGVSILLGEMGKLAGVIGAAVIIAGFFAHMEGAVQIGTAIAAVGVLCITISISERHEG